MSWSGGTYTKGNAGTGGWSGDAAAGVGIEAGRHDTQDNDFATGINNCIAKDGQNTPTNNLPMGGYKHTGVANASANDQYAAWGQLRNGAPVFVDTTNSRLGVGTSTPSSALSVTGTISASNSATGVHLGQTGGYGYTALIGTTGSLIDFGTSATQFLGRILYDNTNNFLSVGTNNAERFRLDSSGNFLFNTTAFNTITPGFHIAVPPATENPYLRFVKTFSGTRNAILNYHNGAYVGGVDFTNTATAFPTSSDYRLKENVVELNDSLARIKALRPVRFNFITEPQETIDGFLAHEVAEIVPNAVSGEKDALNEDGSIHVQALDHSKLIPLLTAAVKELLAKIETLESKIEALENA